MVNEDKRTSPEEMVALLFKVVISLRRENSELKEKLNEREIKRLRKALYHADEGLNYLHMYDETEYKE
jgi:hypothetical protein